MNRSSEATIPAGNRYRSMMAIARRQSDPELDALTTGHRVACYHPLSPPKANSHD